MVEFSEGKLRTYIQGVPKDPSASRKFYLIHILKGNFGDVHRSMVAAFGASPRRGAKDRDFFFKCQPPPPPSSWHINQKKWKNLSGANHKSKSWCLIKWRSVIVQNNGSLSSPCLLMDCDEIRQPRVFWHKKNDSANSFPENSVHFEAIQNFKMLM